MKKRLFSLVVIFMLALGIWADDVAHFSSTTVWTPDAYTGTGYGKDATHAACLSGTFSGTDESWTTSAVLTCDKDVTLSFGYDKPGKLHVVYGATSETDGTFTIWQQTSGGTSSTTLYEEPMRGMGYVGPLGTRSEGQFTLMEATVELTGSGTFSLGGSQPYCIYAIRYEATEQEEPSQTGTAVYDFAKAGTETLATGEEAATYYFWNSADKPRQNSKNFHQVTNSTLAGGNRIWIRIEAADIADGKKNYTLTENGLTPTTTMRHLAITNLKAGDRVRIESTGSVTYVSSPAEGEASISGTTVNLGDKLDSKVTLTVVSGSYIVLLPDKGAVISKISINPVEARRPEVVEPTAENGDGSKTYTVTFQEGETLHYTSPSHDGEQTVAWTAENNGTTAINVSESGSLVCWTTIVTDNGEEASEEVKVAVTLTKDEPTETITIHTIGDSTMSSYDQSIPAQQGMDGWGDYLQDCLKSEWATVYNWADRGETAKSYYNGIWLKTSTDRPEFGEPIADKVKAGDYVIVQFGHNDSKAYSTSDYEEWLGTLVDAIKAKGATPIIASSICRRRFENGTINLLGQINSIEDTKGRVPATAVTGDEHEYDYPYHASQVAQAKGLRFIDVTAATKALYEDYGEDKSAAFFPGSERTHTNKLGAQTIAKVVARILYDDNTALKKYVDTDALMLPDKESIEVVIESFGKDEVVTKKTVWTFNDFQDGDVIADKVICRDGLYVRGGSGNADGLFRIMGKTSQTASVTFGDEAQTSVAISTAATTLNANDYAAKVGYATAGRADANGFTRMFALNIGTPGTFYAKVGAETVGKSIKLVFSGVTKEVVTTDGSVNDLTFRAETSGVIYLCANTPFALYAAMFVPDMEAGTEEDWNYQMVLTRSDGWWTYTNRTESNQKVADGLTAYAVTAIDGEGKAVLQDIGSVIKPGMGVLVKGDANTEYPMASTTDDYTYAGENLLVGNSELRFLPATENGNTNYVFEDGTTGFVKATGSETIHEKQAYLSVSADAASIPLYEPEPEVIPPYGTYDFRKFAVENVSANTDKISAEKSADGILTGTFTSTADGISITGSMTLNDAISVTGAKAANMRMRKNGNALTSTTSGLFINKSQATLNLLKLKEGDWFKIEHEGCLTFAGNNALRQGATDNVSTGEAVVSGTPYQVKSGTGISLNFGTSDAASYIYTIIISEEAITDIVEGDLYISPTGDDANAGSRNAPLKTLKTAQEKAEEGKTIVILPGTYQLTNAEYMDKTSSKDWNVVYTLDKKNVQYIGEVGSDGKRPVFDFSGVTPEDGKRITGFYLTASGITIKNIETVGINIPTSDSNVQSENFRLNGASGCLIKNCAAHHGKGVGFYITGNSKNNTIEDCDAYENIDDINGISSKGQPAGENNDGFGCHVNANMPGNKFVRCRAWYNADDGFDFIRCYSVATIEDCIAYKNGYATYTNKVTGETKLARSGNGNGFKAGGYGMTNDETDKPHPMHMVKGSIAASNVHGFYANHHIGGIQWENNRAYKNNVDYLMTNRKGAGSSKDDLSDVPGYGHAMTANLAYGNTGIETVVGDIDPESCTLAGNSFAYADGSWTNKSYTDGEFKSVRVKDLLLDRDSEGSLPDEVFDFLALKVPLEVVESPTVTLKSADSEKTVYGVTFPSDAILHYKLTGGKENTVTDATEADGKKSTDITVTEPGTLTCWAMKNENSSAIVNQPILLLKPVVYDFTATSDGINADDAAQTRSLTYRNHNDKTQKNQTFRYVLDGSSRLRVLTYGDAGKYTAGTGLYLNKENRPIAIEGLKAGDFIRFVHDGGTLIDANDASTGVTVTDADGNAFSGGIESGKLIKVTATAGNLDDYAVFEATTAKLTFSQIAINEAIAPMVEKDSEQSTDEVAVYNLSFCEGETLHYILPGETSEKTAEYGESPVSLTIKTPGKLTCWSTIGDRQSERVTEEVDFDIVQNLTPVLDAENSSKSKKVYVFKFDSSLKLYYKRAGQDAEFRGQSYKEGFETTGFTVSNSANGYMEYYVMDTSTKATSKTDSVAIMLAPTVKLTKIGDDASTYEIDFFDEATLYYTLGDGTEQTVSSGSPAELTVTKGTKLTAYAKTSDETTEQLSANLYAPTPAIVADSVYDITLLKNSLGIDYVLTSVGYEDEAIEKDGISMMVPNQLTSKTLDRFAFSAPRADGKGETSDWRLLNAGRLRAAKSEVVKHLLIRNVKKGNKLLLTYNGPAISYVEASSTAKLNEDVTKIESKKQYDVLTDGDLLLTIPADTDNNCDITLISLKSTYQTASGDSSSSSSSDSDKSSSSAAVSVAFYELKNDTTVVYRFTWEKGSELRYVLESEETEQSGGTSGTYDLTITKYDKVRAWTVSGNNTSKVVTASLYLPTTAPTYTANYDFFEQAAEMAADVEVILDMKRSVAIGGDTLYMPTPITAKSFNDRFAFSELTRANKIRLRKNRTLTFAKGDDVKMGILNLKQGDIVAFDYTGSISIVNADMVSVDTNGRRKTRAEGNPMMNSGTAYVMRKDGNLLLNVELADSTAVVSKMYVGGVPERSTEAAIDFVTAGEEFESLQTEGTTGVFYYEKESGQAFKWIVNDSRELPIDRKLSTQSGDGTITAGGLTAANRRIAIHDLAVGDQIRLRFTGGAVTFEGHEKNGNIVSVNGRQLMPSDTLRSGDIITVEKVDYLYNYTVLKLDSKVSVGGIYINAAEVEKVSMPTIVDKGSSIVLITAGKSSTDNEVTTCYTTDGSEPTRTNGTSGPYDEFDVELLNGGLITIKAVSYTDGGVYSKVAELTIFADDRIGTGGKTATRTVTTGTYDMQGNKIDTMHRGKLYIRDGKVVFFGGETR